VAPYLFDSFCGHVQWNTPMLEYTDDMQILITED